MGLQFVLCGSVQGVGFRPWVRRLANALEVRGRVVNVPDGVCVEAFGSAPALEAFRARLSDPSLPGVRVESVTWTRTEEDARAPDSFEIEASRTGRESDTDWRGGRVAVAPDLPVCSDCLAELHDPSSRRYRYPFVACAHCGPRYTMARTLPWDRERTAMADFPLCEACAAEYRDPEDRRFHAEATSCPACGPTLQAIVPGDGDAAVGDAALARAVDGLRCGGIVAVQGLGGFHLACDASDEAAVRRLRSRKRRPRRPLAVLVRSVAEAEKHALLDEQERALLESEARPIVLLRRRPDSPLAPSVAPDSPIVGVMLAYAPLHWLLLGGAGGPLVMTSANRAGEPIVHRPADAVAELRDVADLVLANEREIVTPCDDSLVAAAPGGPVVLRRSRGWVPRPLRLSRPVQRPVLAFGGHWSNTLCVASDRHAWPSAHVGDVESPKSVARLEESVDRWLSWLGVEPRVVAHDLHPGYESTRLARTWAKGRPAVGVQHHHAHLAAVLGEHAVSGPAIGLVWDGTGAGPDGTAWGGELLLGDLRRVRRLATFRPLCLAGGDRAIREPWRLALALLQDAFGGDPPLEAIGLFTRVEREQRDAVAALLARPQLCAAAHGVGRYFDAVGALLLERPTASYSGEVAQALNFLASGRSADAYPFALDTGSEPWQIDLRPAVRAIVSDLLDREPPARLADRFHVTLVAAGETVLREALRAAPEAEGGRLPVVLAGGCFQNTILVTGLESRLGRDLEVLRARELPPGDGGLSFGQALVADAVTSAEGVG